MRSLIPLFSLLLSHSYGLIYIEYRDSNWNFSFGSYWLGSSTGDSIRILAQCLDDDMIKGANLVLMGNAFLGATLRDMKQSAAFLPEHFELSHEINKCVNHKESDIKEILLHFALLLWPTNEYAAKNLAYLYEDYGLVSAARDLHERVPAAMGRDGGFEVQWAFAAAPVHWSATRAIHTHIAILRRAHALLSSPIDTSAIRDDLNLPMSALRGLQMNFQYTGVSPGLAMELYSRCVWHFFGASFLSPARPTSLPAPPVSAGRRVRLGVVSEHHSNSSPGLCLEAILRRLATPCPPDDSRAPHRCSSPAVDIVFFDRPNLGTHFADSMRNAAVRVVVLHPFNLEESIRAISGEALDVLLYAALPTEKLTFLLSQHRLAPTQISFGIGHPLTSGGRSIDYSLLSSRLVYSPPVDDRGRSESMLGDRRDRLRAMSVDALLCAAATENLTDSELLQQYPECVTMGANANTYMEQPIYLDTLGFFLDDPSALYPSIESFVHSSMSQDISRRPSCVEIDGLFRDWAVFPNISARALRLECAGSGQGEVTEGSRSEEAQEVHLYACVQILKKLHPMFDIALAGILRRDPMAKILVFQSAEDLIPRWTESLDMSTSDIYSRFVFIPRLPHEDYLKLLSFSKVFLNTFPFGSGITSSEALAMCVPVVVLPELVSVLQIAYAQVTQLGSDIAEGLVVHNIESFISTSIQIASLSEERYFDLKLKIFQRKHLLFGEDLLNSVVGEWRSLLNNLVG